MVTRKKVKRTKKTVSSAADKANRDLFQYYKFGVKVLHKRIVDSDNYLEDLRRTTGRTEQDIHATRRFAQMCLDGELDLEWLCELGSTPEKPGHRNSKPLRRGHILRLIYVSSKRERRTLASRAATKGWSVARLTNEIRKTKPEHRRRGRLGRRPDSKLDALVAVEKMVRRCSRLRDALQQPHDDGTLPKVQLMDLSASVRKPLMNIFKEVDVLQDALDKRIKDERRREKK